MFANGWVLLGKAPMYMLLTLPEVMLLYPITRRLAVPLFLSAPLRMDDRPAGPVS